MNLGKCTKCEERAVIALKAGEEPLCAKHYVEQEDEGCLEAFLQSFEGREITEQDKAILSEVKKQKPKLFEQYKNFFAL